MKCPAFDELVEHAGQSREAQENRELDRHIRSCPDCRETLAVLRALRVSGSDCTTGAARCLTEQELSAYLDHGLAPEAREKVEKHLVECGSCLAEVAQAARTRSALETEPERTPDWLLDRAQALARLPIDTRPATRPVLNWAWRMLVPAFAIALFFVVYKIWPHRPAVHDPSGPSAAVTRVNPPTRPAAVLRPSARPGDTIANQLRARGYKIVGQTEIGSGIIAELDTVMTDDLARVLTRYQTGQNEHLTTILTQLGLRMDGAGIKQVFVSKTLLAEITRGGRDHPILLVLLDDGTLEIMHANQADELNRL